MGNKIRFWFDIWLDMALLQSRFPFIYAVARDKNMLVSDAVDQDSHELWWVTVRRNLQDWEIEKYEFLLQTFATVHVTDWNAKLKWLLTKNGNFLVRSFYNFLASNLTYIQKNFPTMDNLMKKGIISVNRCYLCKNSLETCYHLLLSCSVSHKLWSIVLSLMGLSWVTNGSITAERLAWEGISNIRKTLKLIPLTIFWVLWKERNNCVFEGKEVDFNIVSNSWYSLF